MHLPSVALVISLLLHDHRWSLLFTCFLSLHFSLSDLTCDNISTGQASGATDDYRMKVTENVPVRNFTSVSLFTGGQGVSSDF